AVWCRITVTTLKDDRGAVRHFIAAVENISEHKQAEVEVRDRESELRTLADAMPQLVWIADETGHIFWYNRGWYDYTGSSEQEMLAPGGWYAYHEPDVLPGVIARWAQSQQHELPFDMEFRLRGADGKYRMFLTRATPIRDAQGSVRRWFGTNTDIEELQQARQALQDESRVLDVVNTTGQALVAQLDLQTLLQEITDAATLLSGAKFGAFFYTVTNEQGEVMQLYTLSGAPRSAFAHFDLPRPTPVFGPTFEGGPPIRVADITQDPRYGQWGPHKGMPAGHLPVRSYLALPVRSRTEGVIGGLFFGHPESGVFTERSERIVAGICTQAAVAIDNARLYEAVNNGAMERERLLDAERAAREEAELANKTKDEFLSTLSHELRTPVSAILGWAHILHSGPCTEQETAEALEAISASARAQSKLIDDLLDMSRIVSGKVRLDVQPLDLQAIVESVVHASRPSADARQIRIRTLVDPQADAIHGDPDRLQQVVWNLLTNAVKFTPKGGSIEVRLQRRGSSVELTVSDNGIGIEAGFLPHVFDRFRQADASFSRAHGGLGLGLAIVRQLVEMHGGSVSVESPGKGLGSTFMVSLPLALQRRVESGATDVEPVASLGQPAARGADELGDVDLAGVHVLVVDDDDNGRKVLQRLLERSHARVTVASSAAEALARFSADRPDAVISDIGMPDCDGYEFIGKVRALPAEVGGKVPAMALTAFARTQDRVRALRSGYQAHLAKPFEAHELLATVGSLVGRV
ncbi:MAG: ATP-binding protein, partial [Pseudoxanthomonas sp.]